MRCGENTVNVPLVGMTTDATERVKLDKGLGGKHGCCVAVQKWLHA